MSKDAIPTSSDDMLLALIASIQTLTLTLQANLGASIQPALPMPPPTAPAPSASDTAAPSTSVSGGPILPSESPGPTPPSATSGDLADALRSLSSRGVHPTVLQALPNIVSADESGTWYVVTVGRYTGVYPEWCVL
ncbi:hypothetical protein M413DRAFT_30192 [Hebeloma cylindrosporum]|uniref:Uncharacterized protein n=1 Tax=Hebeloma cylindrosporum TaxID=76867 RepID=A0A0C2YBE9_HEBCY|nr:hypothetical protein M413DRAFT_30192 [Hebeloma cylindrosporum h7]